MNLAYLDNIDLDQRMKSLAQKERDLLHEVLITIKEIDSRRTYLELGFGSLFEYLVSGVGYSEGSAQRRIDGARLIRELPQVAEKIQSGEIKLNQVSLIQRASREVAKHRSLSGDKFKNNKVTREQKLEVIEGLCNKNFSESQHQVAAFFELPVLQANQQKIQADESVRVELTLSKEAFAKVKKAQELLSHVVTTQDLSQFLEYLADKVIQQKTTSGESKVSSKSDADSSAGATVAAKSAPSIKDIKALRVQQKCCQYVDPVTGRKCQSTWRLQVDHKQSRWAGGTHDLKNLQHLCVGHNKLKYRKEAGIRYS